MVWCRNAVIKITLIFDVCYSLSFRILYLNSLISRRRKCFQLLLSEFSKMEVFLCENMPLSFQNVQHLSASSYEFTTVLQIPTSELPRLSKGMGNASAESFFEKLSAIPERSLCIHFKGATHTATEITIQIHGFLWENQNDLFKLDGLKLQLFLSMSSFYRGQSPTCATAGLVNITDLTVASEKTPSHGEFELFQTCIGIKKKFCEIKDVLFPASTISPTLRNTGRYELFGLCSIALVWDAEILGNAMSINQTILDGQIQSDITIVASDDSKLNCHKNFLAAHSSVLATMINTDMQESATGEIELSDMSGEGVKALVAYMYTWDLKEPRKHSAIALELLEASHKYNINSLEKKMKALFIEMGSDWYDVDVAFKLFLFSRNIDDYDEVKMKAVQVLKSRSKEMTKSPAFKKLFKEDAALELVAFAFMSSN